MRALHYNEFGGPGVMTVGEVPDPHIGPDTMLVKVLAAGINPVDYKVREGYLAGLIDTIFPAVPGWDVAGVVVRPGLDTPEFVAGDEVLAYARADVVHSGTLAELVAVPVRTATRKPATVSFEDAAALPLTGLTALQSIRRSGLREGDTVLVHAAAGGVGAFATQLAVLAGARVVGTAGPANHEFLRSLGAEPVAYGEGLVAAARAVAPDGFDVVLDCVGGAALDVTPDLLRPGGSVVSIADGRAASEFGGQYVWVRPDRDDLAELAGLVADGRLRVHVSAVYDLEHAVDAYRALESGHTRGKIVVTP
ncbi:NADP-dependent oxidoreductase [Propionicimonas sp. T2.31MG-18]|uniref:NADP-dependent oxidoreductase n=1 Tax=Propionicimonas sp. T2.31MG-18 TaxID=3157620 RepID=UPI00366EFC41